MSARDRLALAAALAVALAASALAPVYDDLAWLPRVLGVIAVVTGCATLCRRAALPPLLASVAGALGASAYVCLVFARDTLAAAVLPTGATLTALHLLVEEGLTDVERLAPPVPAHQGLMLLAVAGVAVVAVVVDLVAVTLGRAAAAGVPLLVLYAVPSAVLASGLGVIPFALGAAGWLTLLVVDSGDRVGRWGSPLPSPQPRERRPGYADTSLGRVGRRVGAAAIGIAVLAPAAVPGLHATLLSGAGGNGSGGSRTTVTYNPITQIREDLRLPAPREVLSYETDDPHPDYLRLTTLDTFTGSGWSASRLSAGSEDKGVRRSLPAPLGRTTTPTRTVRARLSIGALDARWLPLPAVPSSVKVSGPWLYDRPSETVYSVRSSTQRLHGSYSVTSERTLPDPASLRQVPGIVPPQLLPYTEPPQVTPYVQATTERIIAGLSSPYEKVAAIQAYFQDPHFVYSESLEVPDISSQDALEDFLRTGVGFCEQYASAMAAMVRLAGVPARVAVGFTKGRPDTDGRYHVTTKDAHAWPEAWFAGSGWVRFEPTPRGDGQTTVPAYTQVAAVAPDGGVAGDEEPELPGNGAADEEDPTGLDRKLDRLDPATAAPQGDSRGAGSSRGLLWPAVVLMTLALLSLPVVLRAGRVAARRRNGTPLDAWAQLREDAGDVGQVWSASRSPRSAAVGLAALWPGDERGGLALQRLTAAVERARYAPGAEATPAADLFADVAVLRRLLLAHAPGRTRWRARLAPPSTVRWAVGGLGTLGADLLDRTDALVGATARRLHLRAG